MRRKGESNKSFLTKLQSFEKRCDFRDVGVGFLSGAGQKKNFGGRRQGKARQKQKKPGHFGPVGAKKRQRWKFILQKIFPTRVFKIAGL